MQFSREESYILESLAMSNIIENLDLEEKIIFLRLYCHQMTIREAALTMKISHQCLQRKVSKMREKIRCHLR
jgi:predicted DNA-binding protein (UPF0251 family)